MIVLRMRLTTDIRFRECWRSLALLLAAFLVIAPAPAYATDLPTILATSRVSPPARVAFLEERHNPMCNAEGDRIAVSGSIRHRSRRIVDRPRW